MHLKALPMIPGVVLSADKLRNNSAAVHKAVCIVRAESTKLVGNTGPANMHRPGVHGLGMSRAISTEKTTKLNIHAGNLFLRVIDEELRRDS